MNCIFAFQHCGTRAKGPNKCATELEREAGFLNNLAIAVEAGVIAVKIQLQYVNCEIFGLSEAAYCIIVCK